MLANQPHLPCPPAFGGGQLRPPGDPSGNPPQSVFSLPWGSSPLGSVFALPLRAPALAPRPRLYLLLAWVTVQATGLGLLPLAYMAPIYSTHFCQILLSRAQS